MLTKKIFRKIFLLYLRTINKLRQIFLRKKDLVRFLTKKAYRQKEAYEEKN